MKKLINSLFGFFKYVLLVIAFGLTLFIILGMYTRLNKSLTESITLFLPYGILLLLFIVNICLKRKGVVQNIFFNITCNLVFATNIVVCLRAIYDKNLLFNGIQKMGIDFNYFNDYLSFNKIMLYGLIIADIIFMLIPDEEEKPIAKKIVSSDNTNLKVDTKSKNNEIEEEII